MLVSTVGTRSGRAYPLRCWASAELCSEAFFYFGVGVTVASLAANKRHNWTLIVAAARPAHTTTERYPRLNYYLGCQLDSIDTSFNRYAGILSRSRVPHMEPHPPPPSLHPSPFLHHRRSPEMLGESATACVYYVSFAGHFRTYCGVRHHQKYRGLGIAALRGGMMQPPRGRGWTWESRGQ